MTRYLITGATGMLGRDLQTALAGREVTALGRSDLDVTDLNAVTAAVAGHDVIINCAAYTKVDDAETNEDAAYAVNAVGPRNLALAASALRAKLVQLSTDYVFDGSATTPYAENTPHSPISAYGRTKAAGEDFVLAENGARSYIVRTAWLYGKNGPNFAKTMLKAAGTRDTLNVVNDQVGQPTWTVDLAAQIVLLLDSDAPAGIYHGTNSGVASKFDQARDVFALAGLDPERVLPTDSSAFVLPAPRPAYSVLGHANWAAAGLEPMRSWQSAQAEAFAAGVFETA
ncbi:dTDP-4-dehydrorhamnose reductase [Cryobacterium levicorallinum]|uniref:dTDP-4-dehydrorhamnose reductase n=1 Tax=Cryobacterium levicorallinum TaxID=995038 RepID=A0A1I3DRN7_9MICO|nr:dTDP-4-dehydrorhamnose reductase [Cryobacterium levicorallinum]TFB86273.1 dTDP-4-dehydrorhamnose reductase [Cryobacterium levicorallinum]GEP28408.1 NAD(P)-dependent oxidoreductase [Cryobacterium levicorallinum]SFH89141.1 dTDP-4-dehydrorhamnose reductase [Cryobacterium levicorallinum]